LKNSSLIILPPPFVRYKKKARDSYQDFKILFFFFCFSAIIDVRYYSPSKRIERNNRTTQNKIDSIFIDLQCLFL